MRTARFRRAVRIGSASVTHVAADCSTLFFFRRMRYCPRMVTCNSPRPRANPSRSVRIISLVALLTWLCALAYLSLTPDVKSPAGLKIWDKFSHFAAYSVLTVLLIRALFAWRGRFARLPIVAWLASFGCGLLLEGLQWLTGLGRQWEWGDLLANALGALTVCVVFCLMRVRSSLTNDH